MKDTERLIDLRQFLIYLWERIWMIILLAALFAGAFGYLGYRKQKLEWETSVGRGNASISSIYNQNRDAYYYGVQKHTDAYPPAGSSNITARIYIGFDISSLSGGTNATDVSQIYNRVQADARILLTCDTTLASIIDELNLREEYSDMKNITLEEFRFLINKNNNGTNIMQVVVTDVNAERGLDICRLLVDHFIETAKQNLKVTDVYVVDQPSVTDSRGARAASSFSPSLTGLIKYGIVGGIGGVILAAVVLLVIYVIFDRIRNAGDLAYAGTTLYGKLPKREKNREEAEKRLAYQLLLSGKKVIALVPVNEKVGEENLAEKLEQELLSVGQKASSFTFSGGKKTGELIREVEKASEKQDIVIVGTPAIKEHADGLLLSSAADGLVLLATYGNTTMKDMKFAVNEAKTSGTEMIGTVLNKTKR